MPKKPEGIENYRVALRKSFMPRFKLACDLVGVTQTSLTRAMMTRWTEEVLKNRGYDPAADITAEDTETKPMRVKGGGKDRSIYKVGDGEEVKLYELKIENKISLAFARAPGKPQRSVFITAQQARWIAQSLLRHAENIEAKEA